MEASLLKRNDITQTTSPTGRRQNLLANGVSYTNSDEGGGLRPLLKKFRMWNFLVPCNSKILSIKSANNAEQAPSPTSATQVNLLASVSAPRCGSGRKAAFTLAEVLITLGIIGVVAALTLPTLISNYQKRVYINQLKKSYSVLSNGFRLMMGHDGVTELKDTHAFSGMGADTCGSRSSTNLNNILTNNCSSIREGLTSVFSGIQFAPCDDIETKYLNGTIIPSTAAESRNSTNTCIKFPDGSEIFSYEFRKDSTTNNGRLLVDINGPKNPNTVGRDIFEFWYFNNGIIVPYGSQQVGNILMSLNAENFAQQGITSMYWRTATDSNKCDISAKGKMCAGRVLEEDAMNY